MKVIDLLNKIANGEEVPKLIGYENNIYCWTGCNYYDEKHNDFLDNHICIEDLIYEVEIIEEEKKIPEKLGYFDLTKDKNEKDECGNKLELHYTGVADTFDDVYNKINEIIDYLQSKGE